jgi:hypothetical protein
MPFNAINWATDANYPAGANTWSGTPTKVAPSAGVQADGFAPRDRPPAQWINWLFNSLVTSGQDLETLVGNATLQRAWDRSEAIGAATHINVGTQDLVIGGTAGAILTAENASRRVTLPGVLRLRSLDVPDIESDTYTPVALATATLGGSGNSLGDVSGASGAFVRVGDIVSFSFRFTLNKTGWATTALYSYDFSVPWAPFLGGFPVGSSAVGCLTTEGGSDVSYLTAVPGEQRFRLTLVAIDTLTETIAVAGHYTFV